MATKTTYQSDYLEKLKNPKWQKRRLEILSRDNFTCQRCGDDQNTLHVHHRYYNNYKEPWDYPDKILVTLCESCHETESEYMKFAPKDLANSFLGAGFFAVDFIDIIQELYDFKPLHVPEVVMSAYAWAFENEKVQRAIIDLYFEHLNSAQDKRKKQILKPVKDPF